MWSSRPDRAPGAKSMMTNECTSVRPRSTAALKRWCNAAYINQWRGSRASPEGTGRRHWASICTVLPQRTTGFAFRKKMTKKHLICRPFCWLWRCASKIPSTSPDGWGPGLLRKPLVAATGRVLRPIESIGHAKADFFRFFFIVDPLKKGLGWRQDPW